MPLIIPDEVLERAQLTEREALIEFACRLFDVGRLALGHAARMAGLTEEQMEAELERRNIPRYRYTEEMLEQDLRTLEALDKRKD